MNFHADHIGFHGIDYTGSNWKEGAGYPLGAAPGDGGILQILGDVQIAFY